MGITIHWEGKTNSLRVAKEVVEFVKGFAQALRLEWREYEDVGVVAEIVVRNTTGEIDFKSLMFCPNSEIDRYTRIVEESECFGVIADFPEPVNIETFDFTFFRLGNEWITQGCCKTQVFSEEELPNLYAHIMLIAILLTIKSTWMPDLEVDDEGDFYIPLDKKEREEYAINNLPEDFRDRYLKLKPFNFKELARNHGYLSMLIQLTAEAIRESLGGEYEVKVGERIVVKQNDLSDFT